MSGSKDMKLLKTELIQFLNRLENLIRNQGEVSVKSTHLDSDSILALRGVSNSASEIINIMDGLSHVSYISLSSNIKLAMKMLDDLTYYINSKSIYRNGAKIQLTEELGAVLIPQLISGLTSCMNDIKIDCFFFEGGFLGSKLTEYTKILKTIESAERFNDEISEKSDTADQILERMKLTEKAILRVGLAGAFKNKVRKLFWRILGLDILNYMSLLLIFILTIGIIVDLESFSFFSFLKLKNIGVYERFLIIVPLLFFSWFISKRSQFLYQIKEEYSYKQTSALAYEAYKSEAEEDKSMLNKLLDVTIDNLGRSPLEQFDKNSDHAPYAQFIREFRKKD